MPHRSIWLEHHLALALLGGRSRRFPPPASCTRRGMDGALTALLKANGVSEETATKLSRAPFRITTIKQLANAFDTRAEIKSSFADHGEVQITDLVQITGPKQSWREHRRTRA